MSKVKYMLCALFCAVTFQATCAASLELELLGEFRIPTNLKFEGTPIGGLSAIEYDAQRNVYYALSDDRAEFGPARFYTFRIDVDEQGINSVDIVSSTEILRSDGTPFAPRSIDPESLRLLSDTLYWTSESDLNGRPSISAMDLKTAVQKRSFPIPEYYLPAASSGIRNNRSFESLTLIGNGKLIVGNEEAMQQDGPNATADQGSPSRVITIDLKSGAATAEHVYVTEKIAARPIPGDRFATNGLVELLAMPDGKSMIALERSYSVGQGNVIRIFETQFTGATNVLGRTKLGADYTPMPKELIYTLSVGETFSRVDNIEGITFGPEVNGADTLILVSDNNFNLQQVTQFLVFTVKNL
ncbi:MAG: esterase-like activity of phytase family protein [Pseudomonadota bacterium]